MSALQQVLGQLQADWKESVRKQNTLEALKKNLSKAELEHYESMLEDLCHFLASRQGPIERLLKQ